MQDFRGLGFGFAELLGIAMVDRAEGQCRMMIDIVPDRHFNPQMVAHGGVAYALADTAMGGALTTLLPPERWCATIDIKINYHVGVVEGPLYCDATVLHLGKRVANMDARLTQNDRLVASANGNFAVFAARA